MAILASDAKLVPMDIAMAIGAGRPDFGELQILMATAASDAGVPAHQRKAGFVMFECHRLLESGPG